MNTVITIIALLVIIVFIILFVLRPYHFRCGVAVNMTVRNSILLTYIVVSVYSFTFAEKKFIPAAGYSDLPGGLPAGKYSFYCVDLKGSGGRLFAREHLSLPARKYKNSCAGDTGLSARGISAAFKTAIIGQQVWMTRNLDVTTFRNGDTIPQARNLSEWRKAIRRRRPVWFYYNFDSTNGAKYSKLYNYAAVADRRGLAPAGYHVPTDQEWTTLVQTLGGPDQAGERLKSNSGWGNQGNGNNISGFSALPGGYCDFFGRFVNMGSQGYWWSTTSDDMGTHWIRTVGITNYVHRSPYDDQSGLSVRCLRD